MKNAFTRLAALILFLVAVPGYGQKIYPFQLKNPETGFISSPYSRISFQYDRLGSDTLGTFTTGALNRTVLVVAQPSLKEQVETLSGIQFATSPESPVLLINLRQFYLHERITHKGISRKTGYARFRADVYAQYGPLCTPVSRIDTVFSTASELSSVMEELVSITRQEVFKRIQELLVTEPAKTGISYTLDQIRQSDSLDKTIYPLYTKKLLRDGVYSSFKSFLNQEPDFLLDSAKTWGPMQIWDPKKRKYRNYTPDRTTYAYVRVHKGFITTQDGTSVLERCGTGLCFTATTVSAAASNTGMILGASFGLVGALAGGLANDAINPATATIHRYTIDPVTGGWIQLDPSR